MRLIFGQDQLVSEWVGARLGETICPPYTAIGATKDGQELCAGAVFNNYNGSNIEITLYAPHCMTRGGIRAIHDYLFRQISANRVTAHARRSNKRARKNLERFGFQFEGVQKRFYGPAKADDAFLYALFPEQASKWP